VAARRGLAPLRAARGSAGFYAALPSFGNFAEFTDPAHYHAAPKSWFVVITDIEGSTRAIADGRYKDVNMLAAAGIVAVLNAADGTEIPFVFGGDGATLLVPPGAETPVRRALAALIRLARDTFGLRLRAGIIPVADLAGQGRAVDVARFELSPGNHLALFAGGGAERAESLIKSSDGGGYRLSEAGGAAEDLDLSGLSCRWEPLPSRNGVMLSTLVQALDVSPESAAAGYRRVMEGIVAALGASPDAGNPVSPETLRFRWPPRGLGLEARAISVGRPTMGLWLLLWTQSLLAYVATRLRLRVGPFDARRYLRELQLNADYRRFDDTLRLVVDCTPAQADAIERFLQGLHERGNVAYGLHRSDAALMTCLVFSLERSDHLHFIDGSGGGFTLAAGQLKAQLARRRIG
jgi:hypothetical protein